MARAEKCCWSRRVSPVEQACRMEEGEGEGSWAESGAESEVMVIM